MKIIFAYVLCLFATLGLGQNYNTLFSKEFSNIELSNEDYSLILSSYKAKDTSKHVIINPVLDTFTNLISLSIVPKKRNYFKTKMSSTFYVEDRVENRVLWQFDYDLNKESFQSLHGNLFYSKKKKTIKLDKLSGEEQWSIPSSLYYFHINDNVVLTYKKSFLAKAKFQGLSTQSGEILWETKQPAIPVILSSSHLKDSTKVILEGHGISLLKLDSGYIITRGNVNIKGDYDVSWHFQSNVLKDEKENIFFAANKNLYRFDNNFIQAFESKLPDKIGTSELTTYEGDLLLFNTGSCLNSRYSKIKYNRSYLAKFDMDSGKLISQLKYKHLKNHKQYYIRKNRMFFLLINGAICVDLDEMKAIAEKSLASKKLGVVKYLLTDDSYIFDDNDKFIKTNTENVLVKMSKGNYLELDQSLSIVDTLASNELYNFVSRINDDLVLLHADGKYYLIDNDNILKHSFEATRILQIHHDFIFYRNRNDIELLEIKPN